MSSDNKRNRITFRISDQQRMKEIPAMPEAPLSLKEGSQVTSTSVRSAMSVAQRVIDGYDLRAHLLREALVGTASEAKALDMHTKMESSPEDKYKAQHGE